MHPALMVALSVLVPFGCLGLLLFLSWLEDTLAEDVRKAERRYAPEPVVAVPTTRSRPVVSEEKAPEPVQERPRPPGSPVTPAAS